MSKILSRFPQWISPRILHPVANLGEIPSKIGLRFLPPWICSSAIILARFAVAFQQDFGCRDYCFPARILVRFATGSRQDFGCRDFFFLARLVAGSRQDFGPRDFCFPARILARLAAGSRQDFGRWEFRCRDPGEIPGGQNLDEIPAELAAGSRQDPVSYFTRVSSLL